VSNALHIADDGEEFCQFSSFYLADNLYGLNIKDIKEINNETVFTSIPHAKREVRGYVNIRGQIYLIFDLRIMLGFDPIEVNDQSKIILFKPHVGASFGVLIDRIGDVIEVDHGDVEQREHHENQGAAMRVVAGTCKLEDELLTILDATLFLETESDKN